MSGTSTESTPTTKTIELTEKDATVIAISLAFTSAVLHGEFGVAMAIEEMAVKAFNAHTPEEADALSTKLNTITDLLKDTASREAAGG